MMQYVSLPKMLRPSRTNKRCHNVRHECTHLEDKRSTLRLLVTTVELSAFVPLLISASSYPSSKCLHRFSDSCAFVLHDVHSNLNTTFFVVLAFLWNTGFV